LEEGIDGRCSTGKGVWTRASRIQVYRENDSTRRQITEAQELGADLIIVQVPAETSNSVNLQISQAE